LTTSSGQLKVFHVFLFVTLRHTITKLYEVLVTLTLYLRLFKITQSGQKTEKKLT